MLAVDHPHIAKLISALQDDDFVYLVFENHGRLTLRDQVTQNRGLSSDEVAQIMR